MHRQDFVVTPSHTAAQQLAHTSKVEQEPMPISHFSRATDAAQGSRHQEADHLPRSSYQRAAPQPKVEPTSSIKKETLAESYVRRHRARHQRNDDLLHSKSPHRNSGTGDKNTSQGRGRFRSKSSDKRDHSLRSAVSKDDVMPCYKYKVDGRKRNDVEY